MFVHTPKGALAKPTVNIVTSVGKSWMMWDAAKMTLVFVGPQAREEISSLAQTGTEVFAAVGGRIIKYTRGKESGLYKGPEGTTFGKMLLFGDQLLALKADGSGLIIFDRYSSSECF